MWCLIILQDFLSSCWSHPPLSSLKDAYRNVRDSPCPGLGITTLSGKAGKKLFSVFLFLLVMAEYFLLWHDGSHVHGISMPSANIFSACLFSWRERRKHKLGTVLRIGCVHEDRLFPRHSALLTCRDREERSVKSEWVYKVLTYWLSLAVG